MSLDNQVSQEFSRLSPWAILHFTASAIVQIVNSAIAIVAGGYGLYQVGSLSYVILGGIGIAVLVVVSATLRYLNFSYLIQGESVQIKEGVFAKKSLNLQFHRIQNINIEHPFYFRPLGLVTVKIESAGSASEEVSLAALDLIDGEKIREEVQRFHQSETAVAETQDQNAAPVLTRDLMDLVIHGLTNNRAWIILGVIGTLYSQVANSVNAYVAGLGFDVSEYIGNSGVLALLIIAVGALIIAVAFVAAVSVVGSIISYYKYELFQTEESFRVRRGLLTRYEINMRKSRIQSVRVCRDWLDMVLGRMNVILEQISHAIPGQTPGLVEDKHILVPSVEGHHTDLLTREALHAKRIADLQFTGVSRRYLYKMAAITCCCYFGPAMMFVWFTPGAATVVMFLLPVLVLNLALVYLSWKRWGLAIDGETVVVRKGIIGVDHTFFPAFKLQEISRIRTPLMKRRGLSSIRFSIASRSLSVPFLPDPIVSHAINYCLFQSESTEKSWM